jgi:hypothetical protein
MDMIALLLLAQDEPGRGGDPSGVGGVFIVAAIALVVLVALLAGRKLFKRGPTTGASERRRPDVEGHMGRVGEFRD